MSKRSTHYLHKCYHAGYDEAEFLKDNGEEGEEARCPHVPGTNENAWWWVGYHDGEEGCERAYMENSIHIGDRWDS